MSEAEHQKRIMLKRPSWTSRIMVVCAAWWMMWGAVPVAQALDTASNPEKQSPVFQWIFSLVITGLVLAVAFKNPKRSHQN